MDRDVVVCNVIDGVEMSKAAALLVEYCGIDVAGDVCRLRSGEVTEADLLVECLDGAEPEDLETWEHYVSRCAIVAETPIAIGAVDEIFSQGESEVYVGLPVTIGSGRYTVGVVVGVRNWNRDTVRALGGDMRHFLTAWWADASDRETLPRNDCESVLEAICQAAPRIWKETLMMVARFNVTVEIDGCQVDVSGDSPEEICKALADLGYDGPSVRLSLENGETRAWASASDWKWA